MPINKSFFQRIPFIRITSLFLIGILINHFLQIDFYWLGIILVLLLSILIFLWHNIHYSRVKIHNLLISLCILLSGIFYPNKAIENKNSTIDKKDYFLAEICQKPLVKAKTYQSILWIQSKALPKSQKVIAYFSKENFDTTLVPGDQLIILVKPQQIRNMGNPFELDYKTMMYNKGIDFSVYLTPGTYRKTGIKIHRLIYWAEQARDKLLVLLQATKIEKEERSVVSALTLGYRAELDPETLDYFVNTGTIHVLSVSGLHVALIFFILSFLFTGINKGKFGSILYPTFMILFLWIYTYITGFCPCVQRSAVMFTFVIIGNILRRPVNIYNSLTASILVLILIDPNVLFDIGFQLSYLAVFGIVLLQPPLENLVQLKNKSLKWIWTMLTISLAAQFITFPLSILYFNQFPNLFWLSNYFIIPGTTLLIWLTFGFFVFTPIHFISNLLAQMIQFVTHLMLAILKWMSELPYAVSEGIVFSPVQTLIIYGLFAAFIIYAFSKNKTWLFVGLTFVIFYQGSILWTKSTLFNQKTIYVYNSNNSLIQCINGRDTYVIKNSKYPMTAQEINMIQNACNHLELEKPKFLELMTMNELDIPDLKISDQTISFLNCRINLTDQLKFKIQGSDLSRFKTQNPELVQKEITNASFQSNNSYLNGEQTYTIDFKTKYKEPVILSLN